MTLCSRFVASDYYRKQNTEQIVSYFGSSKKLIDAVETEIQIQQLYQKSNCRKAIANSKLILLKMIKH
jgi:hypothetical protein